MAYENMKARAEILAAAKKTGKAEAYKLTFDLLKHMTTLSSGSVLLLVTFMEKVVRGAAPNIFIGIAFSGFCVSIVAALTTMFVLAVTMQDKISDGEAKVFAGALVIAVFGFFVGIGSLVGAASRWF